jgi:serine/threonine-protein kinase
MSAEAMTGRELGNYTIRALLGEGGMGAVFLGEHRFLGTRVAIKVLHGTYANNPEVSQRFFQEAKASIEIGHPNIIKILDFGQSSDGALYLVMELLEGASLGQTIAQRGPLDEGQAAQIGGEIAAGLAVAHAKGIVHRDLKPDNVFLTNTGAVKILDFGIAKVASSGGSTKSGAVLGTPQFMAPEQARGAKLVGPHTDVYALGAILFFMVTGRPPFAGEEIAELLTSALFEAAPRPGTMVKLSEAMDALIVQCLAKEPAERPADMKVLGERLAVIRGSAPASQPVRPIAQTVVPKVTPTTLSGTAGQLLGKDKSQPQAASRGRGALVAAGLVLAALAVVGATLLRSKPKPAPPPVAVTPAPAPAPAPATKPPAPALTRVVLRSEPPGATLSIDGKDSGTTPAMVELSLPHEVKLRLDGYLPAKEIVVGDTTVKLTPEPKKTSTRPARPAKSKPASHQTGGGLD